LASLSGCRRERLRRHLCRITAEHFDAAYIGADPLTTQNLTHVIQLALHHKVPAIGEGPGLAKLGLLLCYGQHGSRDIARGSEYIDKTLRGAKPSDLPVEQATKVQLVMNLKTAKSLGLAVPPSHLARADEVIE
jgi:putative ABC transport system substrate-binding protein